LASAREGGDAWRRATADDGGVVIGGMSAEVFTANPLLLQAFEALKFSIEIAVLGIHVTELPSWIREHIAGKAASDKSTQSSGPKADQFFEQVAARLEAKGLTKSEAQRNADLIRELMAESPDAGAEFLATLAHGDSA